MLNMLPILTWLFSLEMLRTCNYLHIGDIFGKQRASKLIVWKLEVIHRVSAGLGCISCLHYLRQLSAESLSSRRILVWQVLRPCLEVIPLLPLPRNTKALRISLQR